LVLASLLFGCAAPEKAGEKLRVVTTVGMIDDVVRQIGGDRVQTEALMGPGVDPHLYRPTASDVGKLERADLIFYGGLELEGRMTEIFERMRAKGTPTIAVGEAVPAAQRREHPTYKGRYDPHLWFDVSLWTEVAGAIRDGLIEADPPGKATYEAGYATTAKQLTELDAYVRSKVSEVPETQRVLITAHDAFGYFGDRYGFEVLGVQGTSTAAEAAAGTLVRLADLIAKRKIKAIFVESSVPPATIEALKRAVRARGWDVKIGGELFSDAMGQPGTPEGTYEGMVRHNVETIVQALR
jgi:manganese/zinc/iron transport system substrate-binding protein